MNEEMYQGLLETADKLLALCRAFPARELLKYWEDHYESKDEDGHRIYNRSDDIRPAMMWAVHCEAGDD